MTVDNGASSAEDRAVVNGAASVSAVPASVPSAIVLIREDDPERKPLLYACAKCGSLHSPRIYLARDEVAHETARQAAEDCYDCRTHNECNNCGAECQKGWLACEPCRFAKKFEAAVEVPDDGGPYCAFDGDTYYHELAEAADDGCEWVSPCHVTYPKIDADDVLENLLGDMHEDASTDDLEAVEAFYAAVDAFNKAQKTQSWFGDDKRRIRVPAQAIEARRAETAGSVHESAVGGADAPDTSPLPTIGGPYAF